MRYHYEKPDMYTTMYGSVYTYDHPAYTDCTLYLIGKKGLSVIQQRYDKDSKCTYWTNIDPWLVDQIYLNEGFKNIFDKWSGECKDGYYPTVTIRQLMWALRMKPLKREKWETCFDHRFV